MLGSRLLLVVVLFLTMFQTGAAQPHRPNINVVVFDDMRTSDWQALPQTKALLADGTWLPNYIVTTSLCCPSRSTMLSGKYAHNTEVYDNNQGGRTGGWWAFQDDEPTALPTLLDDYDTVLVGKYLNGYDTVTPVPGWDEIFTWPPGNPTYELNGEYSTDVLRDHALSFLNDGDPDPKFLWFAPFAPHIPAEYEDEYAGDFSETSGLDRDRLRSLESVDDAIAALYAASTPDTVWVLVSDNGFVIDYHGFTGKNLPFDGSQRVKALVRMPGVAPGTDNRIVGNIDLFATILTAAGYPVPDNDGRALQGDWQRTGILIEGWSNRTNPQTYHGVWTKRATYLEWGDDKILWVAHDEDVNALTAEDKPYWNQRLNKFLGCSGNECRQADVQ